MTGGVERPLDAGRAGQGRGRRPERSVAVRPKGAEGRDTPVASGRRDHAGPVGEPDRRAVDHLDGEPADLGRRERALRRLEVECPCLADRRDASVWPERHRAGHALADDRLGPPPVRRSSRRIAGRPASVTLRASRPDGLSLASIGATSSCSGPNTTPSIRARSRVDAEKPPPATSYRMASSRIASGLAGSPSVEMTIASPGSPRSVTVGIAGDGDWVAAGEPCGGAARSSTRTRSSHASSSSPPPTMCHRSRSRRICSPAGSPVTVSRCPSLGASEVTGRRSGRPAPGDGRTSCRQGGEVQRPAGDAVRPGIEYEALSFDADQARLIDRPRVGEARRRQRCIPTPQAHPNAGDVDGVRQPGVPERQPASLVGGLQRDAVRRERGHHGPVRCAGGGRRRACDRFRRARQHARRDRQEDDRRGGAQQRRRQGERPPAAPAPRGGDIGGREREGERIRLRVERRAQPRLEAPRRARQPWDASPASRSRRELPSASAARMCSSASRSCVLTVFSLVPMASATWRTDRSA